MTPQEFNLFAEQAQLDIFEDLFYDYNMQITKNAGRRANTGYPDIPKGIEESIGIFSETVGLQNLDADTGAAFGTGSLLEVNNLYRLPQDYYFINKLFTCTKRIVTVTSNYVASTTGTTAQWGNQLTANTSAFAPFTTTTGDYVVNTLPSATTSLKEYPASIVMGQSFINGLAAGVLTVANNIFFTDAGTLPGVRIMNKDSLVEIEKVSQKRIFNLTNSNLTAPTGEYPAYVLRGDKNSGNQAAEIYPLPTSTGYAPNNEYTFTEKGSILCQYIRYPKTPKWTYLQVGTSPQFNSSAADYQDFELPKDNFQDLVARILQYGGLTIREVLPMNYGGTLESAENTEEMSK